MNYVPTLSLLGVVVLSGLFPFHRPRLFFRVFKIFDGYHVPPPVLVVFLEDCSLFVFWVFFFLFLVPLCKHLKNQTGFSGLEGW